MAPGKKPLSRRMQKQGPPGPLNEALVTRKRKPVAGQEEQKETTSKKQKVTPEKAKPRNANLTPLSNGHKSKSLQRSQTPKLKAKATPGKKPRQPLVGPTNDDDESELDDSFENEMDGSDSDAILQDADDFLGSGSDVGSSDVVDSDAEDMRRAMWSEDEDGSSDGAEQLNASNIEALSAKLDAQFATEAADAQAELESNLQTNIEGDRPQVLEEVDQEDGPAPDLQMLRNRLAETVRVLDEFSKLGEPGRSRSEYTDQLLRDICLYYGYSPYLAEKLFNLFPPKEAFAFFEANETPRPVVLRTNTLRTHRRELAQALINRGVTLEPVGKWSKVGLQAFESQVPLGATPEYLAGHYMLQAASSFLPVMALEPQEHERILDMAAAPGGKTTYMAALMKNTGCIFANDSNAQRAKGLIGNIHRLGVKNTVVCTEDALLAFPKLLGGFDRVLLDAPCSGTGVISKDPSVKVNRTEKDFMRLPHMQKRLLLAAIDSVDHSSSTGGYIVYSTCSVAVEENEQVVEYALSRRPNVKLVSTGLSFGREGFVEYMGKKFHHDMNLARRYYPHAYNTDGFFVAKLQKTGVTPANAVKATDAGKAGSEVIRAKDNAEPVDISAIEAENGGGDDSFGEWDEEEDRKYIEKAKKAAMRRKGQNPKTLGSNGGGVRLTDLSKKATDGAIDGNGRDDEKTNVLSGVELEVRSKAILATAGHTPKKIVSKVSKKNVKVHPNGLSGRSGRGRS